MCYSEHLHSLATFFWGGGHTYALEKGTSDYLCLSPTGLYFVEFRAVGHLGLGPSYWE